MSKIIGALWEKEKGGMVYWSGVLQDLRGPINIAVFPNNRKEADNQPDMNIVISFDLPPKGDGLPKTKRKKKEKDEAVPF